MKPSKLSDSSMDDAVHDAILGKVVFQKTKAFRLTVIRLKNLGMSESEISKLFNARLVKAEAVPTKEEKQKVSLLGFLKGKLHL